jgi:hypothetical protein
LKSDFKEEGERILAGRKVKAPMLVKSWGAYIESFRDELAGEL